VGTLDYMAPEVVSLPTGDERKKLAEAGRPVPENPQYTCKVGVVGVGRAGGGKAGGRDVVD
jgi:hypothetical protein